MNSQKLLLSIAVAMCWIAIPVSAALPPASNFDLSHWKLTLPIDAAGGITGEATEIKQPALQSYSSEFFYTGTDGAMVFWCPVQGATTSGATAPRSELRELLDPSSSSVNWSGYGTHILRAQCKVTQQPDSGAVIIGQVHGYPVQRLVKLQFDSGQLQAYVRNSIAASGDTKFTYTVASNALINYEIKVVDGVAFVTVNGVTKSHNFFATDATWKDSTYYFKAGAYLQDNSGPDAEGGRVSFYQLSVSHGSTSEVAPMISSQPISRSVNEGQSVSFNVTADGSPTLNYQWRKNGVNLPNATGATFSLASVTTNDAGNYTVVVANSVGSVTSAVATLSVLSTPQPPPGVPLAEALDATSLVWTTSGSPAWAGQTSVTHDGSDAAQSGAIGNDTSTSIKTTVVGPGTISFWWKVSSEPSNDRLRFYVNGSEQTRITGEVDWELRTFDLSSGSQALEWKYSKNSSTAGGLDRGWVDQVRFGPTPPVITRQPANQSVDAGSTVSLSVAATGSAPLNYQWRWNEADLSDSGSVRGTRTSTLTLSNVTMAQAGAYSVVVNNAADSVTSSSATLAVTPVLPLADAVDAPTLIWTTSGIPPWIGQANVTHDGTDAAGSGAIGHSKTTSMQTTVQGPGTVSFWWKVSSEPSNDRLLFYVNGSEKARITGQVDWQWRTFNISSGTQTLKWTYSKNSSKTGGVDRAWVDQVQFGVVAPTIATQPASAVVDAGNTATFTVVAAGTALSYRWQFNGVPLSDGSGISGATTATLSIANVQSSRVGTYSVVVSNSANSVTSAGATLSLGLNISLDQALDSGLTFTTGGTGQPWRGQPAVAHDGSDAAQTGAVGDSTYTWIKTTVNGPATVTFWWKISSEQDHDYLRFMMDAADQVRISGEVDWQQITFNVPSGSHELQWRYSKNSSQAASQDRGWVDQVALSSGVAPALKAAANPFEPIVTTMTKSGDEALLTWNGAPGKIYQVFFKDSLADADWIMLAGGVEAIGSVASMTDNREAPQRFYRVTEE